jgi:TolB protein
MRRQRSKRLIQWITAGFAAVVISAGAIPLLASLHNTFAAIGAYKCLQAAARRGANDDANPTNVRSRITVYNVETKTAHVVFTDDKLWEAPNWSPDGKYLLANSGGALYRIPAPSGVLIVEQASVDPKKREPQPERLSLDASYKVNNDHGLTRDGKWLAISAIRDGAQGSQVFIARENGSHPRLMTAASPSYFHSWSPDGLWFAFVAERGGPPFHIYRMAASGGEEQQLTTAQGFDDGPDYSPDGKWIYFNSNRAGGWDIWRMPADGAGPGDAKAERITSDAMEDWFPHPSPDGQWLVFLSFPPGTPGHDVKTDVELRLIPLPPSGSASPGGMPGAQPESGAIVVLQKFFGGQGTINVNSWSPDSKKFAFVSYERLP